MKPRVGFALCALGACVQGPVTSGEVSGFDDTGDTAPPPPAVTQHYFGLMQGQTPDGTYVAPPEDTLFIRTLTPSAGTITESGWAQSDDGWISFSLTHLVDLETQSFTADFSTADGDMLVVGAYDAGSDWEWTAWHSLSTYTNGDYAGGAISSVDTLDPGTGTVHADKSYAEADGRVTWLISETLTPVTDTEYADRLTLLGL